MKKGEHTRQDIIERSAELFNIYGYHGCSLSDIMAATQLRKGGIYNHFKNKDEIALAAFDYSFQEVIMRFRNRLDKDNTPADKLYSIIAVFESFASNPVVKGGCPIFNTANDATDSHPELRQKAREAVNMLLRYVEIKIEEGRESGAIRTDFDSSDFALFLVSTLEGALMISRVNDDLSYMDRAANQMRNYLNNYLIS
ncbi:TetR/AcrR family transcriptional regulator [bacterium SCSIO 12741]|nr:TetR/AcrR family transcriptional regulator [bacterium SCSIO 12741]